MESVVTSSLVKTVKTSNITGYFYMSYYSGASCSGTNTFIESFASGVCMPTASGSVKQTCTFAGKWSTRATTWSAQQFYLSHYIISIYILHIRPPWRGNYNETVLLSILYILSAASETSTIGYVTYKKYSNYNCTSAATTVYYPLGGCSTATKTAYGASFLSQCTSTKTVTPVNDYALVQT